MHAHEFGIWSHFKLTWFQNSSSSSLAVFNRSYSHRRLLKGIASSSGHQHIRTTHEFCLKNNNYNFFLSEFTSRVPYFNFPSSSIILPHLYDLNRTRVLKTDVIFPAATIFIETPVVHPIIGATSRYIFYVSSGVNFSEIVCCGGYILNNFLLTPNI